MTILPLTTIFQHLFREQVDFVLVGGLAAIALGMNSLTNDVDIFYERSPKNVEALVRALRASHPKLRTPSGSVDFQFDEKSFANTLNFTLNTDWGAIDLLGELAGVDGYAAVKKNSEKMELHGFPVQVMSLDDLIACKKAAGRVKDKLHLLELEALRVLRGKMG